MTDRPRHRPGISGLAVLLLVASVAAACPDDGKVDRELIRYSRSGGFTGVEDHLIVFEDGTARVETRDGGQNMSLGKAEVSFIRELIAELDWESLEGSHPPPRGVLVMDGFQYVLVHDRVRVTTETSGVPAELKDLIAALDGVINGAGTSG